MAVWNEITRDDVIDAIKLFLDRTKDFPEAKNTFLIYEGNRLPAKHIRAMAYEVHYGEVISKSEFTGGLETVRFFERLGFDVEYSGTNKQYKKNEEDSIVSEEIVEEDEEGMEELEPLKVGMYIQTEDVRNLKDFNKMKELVKNSDIDILVFPETCYIPGTESFGEDPEDNIYTEAQLKYLNVVKDFASEIGKAVVASGMDYYGRIFSMLVNPNTAEDEPFFTVYVKHTATYCSAFDPSFTDDFDEELYFDNAKYLFAPLNIKGYRVGLTICYDCNHALFSRVYGLEGVDVLINSTGGDVKYNKWYKYNKARSIENSFFNLVTMGGCNDKKTAVCCTLGFDPAGGELESYNLDTGLCDEYRTGVVNVYTLDYNEVGYTPDIYIDQEETISKESSHMIKLPKTKMEEVISKAKEIDEDIYLVKGEKNVIILSVDEEEIFSPEYYLDLMYSDKLKDIPNKAYIIYNKWDHLEKDFFEGMVSVVLKARVMESYCGLILESDNYNLCYQTSSNRESQLVKPVDGFYNIDLNRCGGPEVIWKNKEGMMRASWRKGYEKLIDKIWEERVPIEEVDE